jgi:hypothetical protein
MSRGNVVNIYLLKKNIQQFPKHVWLLAHAHYVIRCGMMDLELCIYQDYIYYMNGMNKREMNIGKALS